MIAWGLLDCCCVDNAAEMDLVQRLSVLAFTMELVRRHLGMSAFRQVPSTWVPLVSLVFRRVPKRFWRRTVRNLREFRGTEKEFDS